MEVSSGSWFETPRTLSDDPSVVTDLEVRTTRRGRILSKAASTQRAHAGTKGAFFAGNRQAVAGLARSCSTPELFPLASVTVAQAQSAGHLAVVPRLELQQTSGYFSARSSTNRAHG